MSQAGDLLDQFNLRFAPKRKSISEPPHDIYQWTFESGYDACLAEVKAFLEEHYGVRLALPTEPEPPEPHSTPVDQILRE